MAKPHAVVFDMDGVLVDNSKRLHNFINMPGHDWDVWYRSLEHDPPFPGWIHLLNLLVETGMVGIIMSARPERIRELSTNWLRRHGARYHILSLWDGKCPFKDCKANAVLELQEHYDICLAVDDAIEWVQVFESFGIPTLHASHSYTVIDTQAGSQSLSGLL